LTEEARGFNNNNNMNNNYDIKPGTDKFLRLHIDDLSKLTLNEMNQRKSINVDRTLTPVIVTATITGFIIGIIAAYCLGLLPN
jgi:hypothetical protein